MITSPMALGNPDKTGPPVGQCGLSHHRNSSEGDQDVKVSTRSQNAPVGHIKNIQIRHQVLWFPTGILRLIRDLQVVLMLWMICERFVMFFFFFVFKVSLCLHCYKQHCEVSTHISVSLMKNVDTCLRFLIN